jgi:alpha-galactosidase
MLFTTLIASSVVSVLAVNTKTDGIALKPPMGWNSWNSFKCDITEKDVRIAADELVSLGTLITKD